MATIRRSNNTPRSGDLSKKQWLLRFLILFVPLAGILVVIFSGDSGLALMDERSLEQLGIIAPSTQEDNGVPETEEVIQSTENKKQKLEGYLKVADRMIQQHKNTEKKKQTIVNNAAKTDRHAGGNVADQIIKESIQEVRKEAANPVIKETPSNSNQKQYEPLNIVLFYADDWTMKVMGKLNPHVQTPNIDRMANQGMLFSNNCVTTSICWISRATLVTGTYAARHQQLDPSSNNMFTNHDWNQTLFPLMKSKGYYTGIVGKWHSPQPAAHMAAAFDFKRMYYGSHWMRRGKSMVHVTQCNEDDSIEFLRKRPKNQKFFLKVSFFATHAEDGKAPESYKPQKRSLQYLYQNVTIPTPKTATDEHWKRLPPFFTERNEGRNRWRLRFEPDYYQDNIKNLYRMATEVDTAVGNIIKELKEQGVYNNTLLIFTTDNGNLHGEHGLAEKWYPFEESIRVPLVIQDPRMPKNKYGVVNEDWTLSVDLTSTILGAAGIPSSDFMQGRDMADLYLPDRDGPETWRQDWFYEYNRGDRITAQNHPGKAWIDASFALVNKEWKYIYWPNHNYEQLFHRSIDPYDEWDTLKKDTVKTTDEIYQSMKKRYQELKRLAQSGQKI